MDVVLINPSNTRSKPFGITAPMGLAFLGNILLQHGFSVKVLDLEIKPDDFNLRNYILETKPKIVGISGTTHSRFESFRIAREVKAVSSDIFTVYGGCHATFTAEDSLLHIKEIDFVVRGEGELVFLDLVKALTKGLSVDNIPGLSFRKADNIIHNAAQDRIRDLDSIPYARGLLEMDRYSVTLYGANLPAVTVITSRGCPFNCSFCSASAMFGRKYFMRSVDNIISEISSNVELYGVKAVRFFDSTLTLDRQHINFLLSGLKGMKNKLLWHCELRANTVDRQLLRDMKEAGCYSVDFGLESASQKVLKVIGKEGIIEQAVNVLEWCKEFGIRVVVFFSFGHLNEEWQDTAKTLEFIDRYYDYMSPSPIFGVRIYPGTFVERYAIENKLLPDGFSWSDPFTNIDSGNISTDNVPIILQPKYGLQELNRAYTKMQKIDSRKMLRPAFMLNKIRSLRGPGDFLHKAGTMFKLVRKSVIGN